MTLSWIFHSRSDNVTGSGASCAQRSNNSSDQTGWHGYCPCHRKLLRIAAQCTALGAQIVSPACVLAHRLRHTLPLLRQVQLLLDLDRLGQIIARNRSNTANRCLACARDRPSMVGTTINRRDMNHSERNYEIQQLETSRHEAATAVCLSVSALDDASIRAAMTCLEAHHDVTHRIGVVAFHGVDRRAVNMLSGCRQVDCEF